MSWTQYDIVYKFAAVGLFTIHVVPITVLWFLIALLKKKPKNKNKNKINEQTHPPHTQINKQTNKTVTQKQNGI